jgi:hypothetical protein
MKLWDLIRSLRWRHLRLLISICLSKPLWVWPSWNATQKSLKLASKYYGPSHRQNTAANAFRHALWNYLIADACTKKGGDTETALFWTKKITELHEELYPNKAVERQMDLHNNAVGRRLFRQYGRNEQFDLLGELKNRTDRSIKIDRLEDLAEVTEDSFVHIINTKNER